MTCRTPTHHVCDLNASLDTMNSTNTNLTNTNSPNTNPPTNNPTAAAKPPTNHLIVHLTSLFRNAILENDVFELDAAMKQYARAITCDPKFMIYDHTDLRTARTHAMQILNSNAASIDLPASLPSTLPNSLLPVSNPSNWSPRTGVASPTISILGCPQL